MRNENVHDYLGNFGKKIKKIWKDASINAGLEIELSGIDPLAHFDFSNEKKLHCKTYFIQLMLEQGFLANNSFYVSYSHDEEFLKKYQSVVEEAFKEIKRVLDSDNFDSALRGDVCQSGFKRLL